MSIGGTAHTLNHPASETRGVVVVVVVVVAVVVSVSCVPFSTRTSLRNSFAS